MYLFTICCISLELNPLLRNIARYLTVGHKGLVVVIYIHIAGAHTVAAGHLLGLGGNYSSVGFNEVAHIGTNRESNPAM